MDLRDRVSTSGGVSRGLLDLVFHPHYADNGYFFVHYTNSSGNSVIARYNVSDDPNITDHQSEFGLLEIEYPLGEHIGGDLAFGPDGYLYISIGDGGGPGDGDQEGNAQNLDSLLGKLLRIDVDGGEPYHIPVDNPFAFGGGKPEVWVSGLRNPWRFSFDPLTGDTYVADVGENQREELNYLPADMPGGANMGWNYYEGSRSFRGEAPDSLIFIYPLVEYDHMEGCSITGGSVYRGTDLPDWYGVYIYGDYCQGKVWGLLQKPDGSWENELLYKLPAFITSFGQDEAGEIYLVDMTGKIYKLVESDKPK
jgi:glucose/arabinose dehydrogenase